jgi:hypothetical protein
MMGKVKGRLVKSLDRKSLDKDSHLVVLSVGSSVRGKTAHEKGGILGSSSLQRKGGFMGKRTDV